MFIPLTEAERQSFLAQGVNSFIPGYTGHCPTLKFHYGKCYGAKTKEIMQELRDKGFLRSAKRELASTIRQPDNVILKPIPRMKDQNRDYALDTKHRASKYIIGYTGFIPTLNFRYGKSYGRAADDSVTEFSTKQQKLEEKREEEYKALRVKSAPRMAPIRGKDEVDRALREYQKKHGFKERTISPDDPPIAGYTGHIPRVKGNEESLSHRYNTVVKRGLTLLKEDREKKLALRRAQNKIDSALTNVDGKYSYTDC